MARPREQLEVLFSALDVAYRAKDGACEAFDVAMLQSTAEEVFKDHADPVFRAINTFATDFDLWRRDVVKLAEIGEALRHAVELALMPVPPDAGRADIHG